MASLHQTQTRWHFAVAVVLLSFASVAWSFRAMPLPDSAPSSVYRWKSKAVQLASGNILVAGGYAPVLPHGILNSEINDAQTGFWAPTGHLQRAHASFDMILLNSGDVLIAGGEGSIASERFSIATQTWSPTQNQPPQRVLPTLSKLPSGKVLMVGGSDVSCCWGNSLSTWIYDPAVNQWHAGPNAIFARHGHTATTLTNQDILIVGGSQQATPSSPAATIDFVERFDSASLVPRDAGNLLEARSEHAAILLNDGRVLVVGGHKYVGSTKQPVLGAEIYDPFSGGWRPVARPDVPRMGGHTLTIRWDGVVTLMGGVLPSGIATNVVEQYNPTTNTWVTVAPLNYPRAYHTATTRNDGRILVDGGSINGAVPTEVY